MAPGIREGSRVYGKGYMIRKDDLEHVATVRAYIELHYPEEISIAQLAKLVHMSPTKLKYCFQQSCSVSIHRYLTQIRVKNAMRLIREEECLLSEIAVRVGFKKPGSLSAVFKKQTGLLPREYRRQHAAEEDFDRA